MRLDVNAASNRSGIVRVVVFHPRLERASFERDTVHRKRAPADGKRALHREEFCKRPCITKNFFLFSGITYSFGQNGGMWKWVWIGLAVYSSCFAAPESVERHAAQLRMD